MAYHRILWIRRSARLIQGFCSANLRAPLRSRADNIFAIRAEMQVARFLTSGLTLTQLTQGARGRPAYRELEGRGPGRVAPARPHRPRVAWVWIRRVMCASDPAWVLHCIVGQVRGSSLTKFERVKDRRRAARAERAARVVNQS